MEVKDIILEIEMMRDDPDYFLTADKASVLMMYVIQARLTNQLPDISTLEAVVQRISEHANRTINQLNRLLDSIDPAIANKFTVETAPTIALFTQVPSEFERMLVSIKTKQPFTWSEGFINYLRT